MKLSILRATVEKQNKELREINHKFKSHFFLKQNELLEELLSEINQITGCAAPTEQKEESKSEKKELRQVFTKGYFKSRTLILKELTQALQSSFEKSCALLLANPSRICTRVLVKGYNSARMMDLPVPEDITERKAYLKELVESGRGGDNIHTFLFNLSHTKLKISDIDEGFFLAETSSVPLRTFDLKRVSPIKLTDFEKELETAGCFL